MSRGNPMAQLTWAEGRIDELISLAEKARASGLWEKVMAHALLIQVYQAERAAAERELANLR